MRRHHKATKTYKSRDVDLQQPALEALKRQRQLTFRPGGHVFLNPQTGEPFVDTADPVRKVWRPTLSALGIRDRDARQTRHTYATLGLHAGMNPGYLSRQMGHKNAQMFFRVYSKWIDGESNQREKAKMAAYMPSICLPGSRSWKSKELALIRMLWPQSGPKKT